MEPASLEPRRPATGIDGRWRALLYLPLYLALIGLISALWSSPGLLTACCAVLAVGMLVRWHSRSDVLFFLVAAVMGPLGESVAVSFGAWQYALPWAGIPLWLPLGWGIAVLYLKKTNEVLLGHVGER